MAMIAVAMLVFFSACYGVQVLLYEPPNCGCLGRFLGAERMQGDAKIVLARNLILATALFCGILIQGYPQDQRVARVSRSRSASCSGFTLIETILAIGIIAILISLAIRSLSRVRLEARSAASLAQLRQHGAIFTTYTTDWDDTYPYFTYPNATYTILAAGGRRARTTYFGAQHWWFFALADRYYDGNPAHPAFYPPGYDGMNPPYVYSATFLADARYWNWKTRTGRSQWRPVRNAEVGFPSEKGLLVSWGNAWRPIITVGPGWDFSAPGLRLETAFCDGSAQSVRYAEFLPWVPDGPGPFAGPGQQVGWPVVHTRNGSRGRDVRR